MQVYRGLDVGTAKPSAEELAAVPHHLVDVADPDEDWSVVRTSPRHATRSPTSSGGAARALLVGGTGLYVQAVVDDLRFPGEDLALRAELEAWTSEPGGVAAAYAELERADPAAAARIDPHNARRIVRALEVIRLTGQPFSSFGPGVSAFGPTAFPVRIVGVWLPRDVLAGRIEMRVTAMRDAGLTDEVRRHRDQPVADRGTGDRVPGGRRSARRRARSRTTRTTSSSAAHGRSHGANGCGSGATRGSRGWGARRIRAGRSRRSWQAGTHEHAGEQAPRHRERLPGHGRGRRCRAGRRGRARALCDRHRGVGADGLITLLPGRDGADCTMELRNADGEIAEMSGNGHALPGVGRSPRRSRRERGTGRRHGRRPSYGDARHRRRDARGARPSTWGRSRSSPPRSRSTRRAPSTSRPRTTAPSYQGDAAGVGNPHLVLLVDDVAAARVTQHGPHLEVDERFPKRTNVEFVQVLARDRLRMRVWERGVGETLSCGTGVCASAAVAHRRGLVDASLVVEVPGGEHTVALGDTVTLGGDVQHVFDVDVDVDELVEEVGVSRGAGRGRRRLTATEVDLDVVRQRALLVGTGFGARTADEAEASLAELAAARRHRRRRARRARSSNGATAPIPPPTSVKGKAESCATLAEAIDIDVVVFDDELTPAQQRNLEQLLGRDVVDRVALILDIFAQHATSQEGMVQVELAQLRYRLPRLRGRGVELSQQAGGIGTRGPGETQLEVDRRRIQRRITKLEGDLKRLARTRATQRKARTRRSLPTRRARGLHERRASRRC